MGKTKVLGGGSGAAAVDAPPAWLVPQAGRDEGTIFPVGRWTVVGCSVTKCHIVLAEEHLSGEHVALVYNGDWYAQDLGSTNRTWLDGQELTPQQRYMMKDGAVIKLGTLEAVFKCL